MRSIVTIIVAIIIIAVAIIIVIIVITSCFRKSARRWPAVVKVKSPKTKKLGPSWQAGEDGGTPKFMGRYA
jgi:uncharacterized membrane protein YqiK